MLIVAHAEECDEYSYVFEQMYRLRATQFSQRRGWRVVVEDGFERDRFDDLNPLYLCLVDSEYQLLASLRLLPTVGPHMLSDVFPEVMGTSGIVRHPLVWESSRFCVDTNSVRAFGDDGVNVLTRSILAGLFATAHKAGMQNIISVYDLFVERILRRSGCVFERLGPVVRYDDLKTVGGLFEVSDAVVRGFYERDERVAELFAA